MSLSNQIWAEQPAPSCLHCEKPCPQDNAYRCLACKGWYHATCLGIHFGGTVGAESNDQQRIRHLENAVEFWRYRAGSKASDEDVNSIIFHSKALLESRDLHIKDLEAELIYVKSERDRLAGFKEGVLDNLPGSR